MKEAPRWADIHPRPIPGTGVSRAEERGGDGDDTRAPSLHGRCRSRRWHKKHLFKHV